MLADNLPKTKKETKKIKKQEALSIKTTNKVHLFFKCSINASRPSFRGEFTFLNTWSKNGKHCRGNSIILTEFGKTNKQTYCKWTLKYLSLKYNRQLGHEVTSEKQLKSVKNF